MGAEGEGAKQDNSVDSSLAVNIEMIDRNGKFGRGSLAEWGFNPVEMGAFWIIQIEILSRLTVMCN